MRDVASPPLVTLTRRRVAQVSRVLNLATLAFTIVFSGFLLLFVDWGGLTEKARPACIEAAKVRVHTADSRHLARGSAGATRGSATWRSWAYAPTRLQQ